MSQTLTKPPAWFWIIAAVALVWNLMGVGAFVAQVTTSPEALAALPEAERAYYENFPLWALLAFAVAVFGGAIGSLLLLLRKALAKPVFVASLIGVIVQMSYNLTAGVMDVYGPGALAMPIMILLFAIFLIWFAGRAKNNGWIN